MAKQHKSYGNLISIMGGILVALGLHILLGHLSLEAAQLRHLLGIPVEKLSDYCPQFLRRLKLRNLTALIVQVSSKASSNC